MDHPPAAMVLAVVLVLAGHLPAAAGEGFSPHAIPAPFDSWNVTVTPEADPRIVELAFDSAILGLRAISHVYLPDAYFELAEPLPVAYFLHGTVRIHTGVNGLFDELADRGISLGYPFSAGNGRSPTEFVRHALDRAGFLVVTPDSGPTAWCEACFFVDDYHGGGVAAESHLYEELMPVVEAVFRVRRDRAGRAIFGRSMGGGGALIQGVRHPDRFAFVAALSPTHLDWLDDPVAAHHFWKNFLDGQGYPPPEAAEITYRNLNPADMAPNTIGTNQEIVVVAGDACVDHSEGSCAGRGIADDPRAWFLGASQEIAVRRHADQYVPRLLQAGVPVTYVEREGHHGVINRDTYERILLPRMNKVLAEGTADPQRFSYKTADRRFTIWGYDFEVDRTNEEFLHVFGARLDGRELVLAGTGTVVLRTPPAFVPAHTYRVVATPLSPTSPLGQPPADWSVTADDRGRLEVTLVLGAARPLDERRELVEQGLMPFPQTRIEVSED